MLRIVVLVHLVSLVSARYATVLKEGVFGKQVRHVAKLVIPDGQCTGGIVFPKDYACHLAGGALLPIVLQVEVRDEAAPPSVSISKDRSRADVYREGPCRGRALILLGLHCAGDNHPPSPPRARRALPPIHAVDY